VNFFEARAASVDLKLSELAGRLKSHLGVDEQRVLQNDTCIYTVGSGGRGEMSEHSDVDLFVARVHRAPSEVDAFQIRQAIARALFEMDFPEPSQGGGFLKMHTGESLCERMGTRDDDASNTLTARMLLLLESRVLLGDNAYGNLVDSVLDAYWKDASDHTTDYQPFVLVNDIVRYWRILLLNYVAKNAEKERELAPPNLNLRAERSLRSYKLRFSRCITCFSALARLLSVTARGAVEKKSVAAIVRERPIQRLVAVKEGVPQAGVHVDKMLQLYQAFLENTSNAKTTLIESFGQNEYAHAHLQEGRDFADAMFALLQELGRGGRAKELFRHMVV
jgi:predicted nucleotidyltransferase